MAFSYSSTNNPAPKQDVPQSVDSNAWRLAEEAVRARNGGFAGVSEETKQRQIKEAYDQLQENNAAAAKWEGTETNNN